MSDALSYSKEGVRLASLLGATSVLLAQKRALVHLVPKLEEGERSRKRHTLLAGGIRACGAALWPGVLFSLVPMGDVGNPVLLFPLAWVFGIWAVDSHFLHNAASSDLSVPASIRMDPSAVTAMSFGLCSLVGARSDGPYTHLILYAVVGCIVGVFPSHNLLPGSTEQIVFDNVQKTLLIWCVGLLIAGVGLAKAKPS